MPKDSSDPNLLRKKKNADAQAAFRARRQNYISTLEETVTSLESVVIQLQDSCRESRTENIELRQEISRLRYQNREREKYWKSFLKKSFDVPPAFPVVLPQQQPGVYTTDSFASDPRWPSLTPQSFDRKPLLDSVLSTAPYVFPTASRYQPDSRSLSPTTSTSSPSSLPLTASSYQLAFPSTTAHTSTSASFDYRDHPQHVTLHGTGSISDFQLAESHHQHHQQDSDRFSTRSDSNPDNQDHHHHIPILPETEQQQIQDSPTLQRRNIPHPYCRSQSPGPTPLSSTVAVIKAQAFGALRRTRAKSKKTTDSAARVAQDVLEARGIGAPIPSSSRSHHEEHDDVGKH